jgi:hypothetical protein
MGYLTMAKVKSLGNLTLAMDKKFKLLIEPHKTLIIMKDICERIYYGIF